MNFDSTDPDNGDDDRKRDSSRKRDGKRDKKEKGYHMFEEEDSEDEHLMLAEDVKSPSKQKKERAKPHFKFPVRKEKGKEKEEKKDKDTKKEEKEKKREEKEGKKVKKDKKKAKHAAAVTIAPSLYENPIFGVPLALAVERNKSHDGIELPAIVRECIDYIEECGLACEGIYRISGVKSKVQHLKDCYNRHEPVYLLEHEPNVVASLLKQFLRDLPEPVLTTALMPKFEEASVIKNNKKKTEAFTRLIGDLPTCNRLLLSWMIVHMTHVIELAKENKMTLQNVSIVLSPTMQISHRVLNILFSNVHTLFIGVTLRKYVPPLKPAHSKWSLELPDNPAALEEELAKQESLLNQLHADLNSGLSDPEIEEQLWEVQRVVTQLKRKIKMAKKNIEMGERRKSNLESKKSSTTSLPSLSAPEELHLQLRTAPSELSGQSGTVTVVTAVVEKQPTSTDGNESSPPSERKGVRFAQEPEPSAAELEAADAEEREAETQEDTDVTKAEADGGKNNVALVKGEGTIKTEIPKEIDTKVELERSEVDREIAEEKKQEEDTEMTKGASKESLPEHIEPETGGGFEKVDCTKEKTPVGSQFVEKETENNIEAKVSFETTLTEEKGERAAIEVKADPEEIRSVKKTKAPSIPIQESKATPPEQAAPQNDESPPASSSDHMSSQSEEKMELEQAPVVMQPPEMKKQPSIPPFMSMDVLQPMKVEPPKGKPVAQRNEDESENLRQSEQLRELEEELLGFKKKKVVVAPKKEAMETEEKEDDGVDEMDMDQLLEHEYAMSLEEEELLAIADELRQKIATERSEMERLTQEIQELQYLRQDSDLEDLSSSSSSSEDSEDEEDLQGYLGQLLQENQDLEMSNTDLCQKIHEERMICLSVKLQIRLLQQKQLEASYG